MDNQTGLEMRYFILKPRGAGPYAQASREAMLTYAMRIENENPQMASELRDWVDREANAAQACLLKQAVDKGQSTNEN